MTFTPDGVKLKKQNSRKWLWSFLIVAEVVLSIFLYISLAAHTIWPEKVGQAAVGVAQVLSYEGRLTDTSGNALGGTGTQYCFRFAIYDANTAGTKLWPAATPATTTANVIDGVFDATVGSADTLTYDFYDSDTTYLDVAVNTTSGATCTSVGSWESLSPRQRISATGYAITAANVYGTYLKTNSASSTVQFGTGTGTASPVLAGLDWHNDSDSVGAACSPSGTMWYNSSAGVLTALVCNNSIIQRVGSLATTTISAITAGTTTATSGTVSFANTGNVTFGMNNAGVITANGPAGGGGTIGYYEPFPMTNTALFAPGAGSWYFAPFVAPQAISGGRINLLHQNTSTAALFRDITGGSYASNSTGGLGQSYTYSKKVALYSQGAGANSTRLESFWSNSFSFGWSKSVSVGSSNVSQFSLTVAHSISYISEIGSNGAYTLNQFANSSTSAVANSSTASNWGDSLAVSIRNMLSNSIIEAIGFNTTITPGAYWLAFAWSTTRASATSANWAAASALDFSVSSEVGISRLVLETAYRNWASTVTTARSHIAPYGLYTGAANMAPPQYVILSSDLSSLASAWIPYFNFQNQGITK